MIRLLTLLALFADPSGLNGTVSGSNLSEPGTNYSLIIPSYGAVDDGPICKVVDSSEYEPCAWQEEREAEAERLKREVEAKAECVAKGCLVVRQKANFVYTTWLATYPPSWRCDCKAKPRPAKSEKCK